MKLNVMTELETLRALVAGKSIARFGDGEFKLAVAGSIRQQHAVKGLVARLNEILQHDGSEYMVGIPRLTEDNPKNDFWVRLYPRVEHLLRQNFTYASSLISRPDNCPWIDNAEYYDLVRQLWTDKRVLLVWGGSRKSFTPSQLKGAKSVDVIQSLPEHAWKDRRHILEQVNALSPKPDVALIALGPTATGIVPDFVKLGIQAIDIGHLGGYMRKFDAAAPPDWNVKDFVWPRGAEKYGSRYIYRTRDLTPAIDRCVKRRCCVQAGGHVGIWPKYLARYFSYVYTFEPEHENFLALSKNVTEEGVFKFQAALGDEHTPIRLSIHENNIGGHHVAEFGGPVPQFRIDDLGLHEVDLIVLDIEGSELAAIRGAQATILRSLPVIHLEMRGHIEKYKRGSTHDLELLLNELEYVKADTANNDSVYVPRRGV